MKKFLSAVVASVAVVAPVAALAAQSPINNTFTNLNSTANGLAGFISALTRTVNAVVPLLLAVAVVVFIFGVVRYILAKGADDTTKARNLIIWGIIGIAVSIAVLGLANLLIGFFGINTGNGGFGTNDVPYVPTNS